MFPLYSFILVILFNNYYCYAVPAIEDKPIAFCKLKNSNVNECLKNYLQEAIRYSSKGNSKYSIPSLDPYYIPKLMISPKQNVSGLVIEMKNSSNYGFSKAIVKKIESDPANGQFEVHYTVPVSTSLGNYDLTGKIFSIPINGEGKSNVTMIDLYTIVKLHGDVTKNPENGRKYLRVKSVTLHVKPRKIKFRFEQLFKENKELGEIINNMLNDNWKEVFGRLQPELEKEMSRHMFAIVKNFFSIVPYDELFPDV